MGKYKQHIQEQDDRLWEKVVSMCKEEDAVEVVLHKVGKQIAGGQLSLPLGYSWEEFEEKVKEAWDEVWYKYNIQQ